MAFHYSGVGPPSYGRFIELYPIIEDTLRRSGIKPMEKVVLYTDTKKNKDIVDAFFAAAVNLGAEVAVVMTTPRGDPDRTPVELALKTMREADTILDMASTSWIYTPAYSELLKSGVRILCNMSDPDTIIKMAPRDDIAARAKRGGELIHNGKEIRVRSKVGTDLVMRKDGRKGSYQNSFVEGPGSWDNVPSAQCACAPLEDSANGKLVIDRGDILLTIKRIVTDPITCTLENGRITKIEGGGDASLLRDWFARWNDPKSYITSHIGFGCDPRCEIAAMQLMEWESYAGGIMIAFGSNAGYFLQGATWAKSHIDIVLLNADFDIDGVPIVRGGQFVHEDLK